MASEITITLILKHKGRNQKIILYMDILSALRWLYKASFKEIHTIHDILAQCIAHKLLNCKSSWYYQLIRGKYNLFTDYLLSNHHITNTQLIAFSWLALPDQVHQIFVIATQSSKIS